MRVSPAAPAPRPRPHATGASAPCAVVLAALAALSGCNAATPPDRAPPAGPLAVRLAAASPVLARALADPALRVQVALGAPRADGRGRLALRRETAGDLSRYFYPASAIKLCGAVAALLELREINARQGRSFDLDARLAFEPLFPGEVLQDRDESHLAGGFITLGHEIRKLFVVSDNRAFNRTLEFAGHRGINERMWRAGFGSVRIHHRLSERRTLEENRRSPAISLTDPGTGERARLEPRASDLVLPAHTLRETSLGTAHSDGERTLPGPFDFSLKNHVELLDLQDLLAALVRPEIATGKRGFPELGVGDRAFLLDAMSRLPRESDDPRYDPASWPDDYVKFLLPGLARVRPAAEFRIYNKVGRAYGFSIENAYVEHVPTGRGLFVAAVIYTNENGVVGDGVYEYEEIADPFFAALGEVVARELVENEGRLFGASPG